MELVACRCLMPLVYVETSKTSDILGLTFHCVFASNIQKKNATTSAAEYKKTDEAQPDVKEEEEEEEEAEEAESSGPGGYQLWLQLLCRPLKLTCGFISATEEKNEDSPAEKEEDQEVASDEVS